MTTVTCYLMFRWYYGPEYGYPLHLLEERAHDPKHNKRFAASCFRCTNVHVMSHGTPCP